MDGPQPSPFAVLLRRLRLEAGLSQEALAERAGISLRAVSDLERGVRRLPYRETVDLLAQALGLTDADRAALHAAVPRRRAALVAPATQPGQVIPGTNIRAPSTSFIGREADQATVRRLLASSRLLTLTGTGGVGKTRLATQVAAELAGDYADGVRLVELATIVDPALVPAAVARAVDVREQPGRPLMQTLAEALRDTAPLIILDNCEHLRAAAGAIAETLLRTCPALHILATSREALGIIGETVWWVPSMTLPAMDSNIGATAVAGPLDADAVRLFADRALSAHPAFALTERNAGAIAAICRRLDGIPLAIELAAARARILTPEQIAARLDERFRLLANTDPQTPIRQQTLQAALTWSYDLLTPPERRLLENLATFAGGCTIEAIEVVCDEGDEREQGIGNREQEGQGLFPVPDSLFPLLTSLVEKSLVSVEYHGESARYRLLETVRAFGLEQLAARGELLAAQERHAAWCLDLAAREGVNVVGREQPAAIAHLSTEVDNLRAALVHFERTHDAGRTGELAVLLWRFWLLSGRATEGRDWISRALALGGSMPPDQLARLLDARGTMAQSQGDYAAAQHDHEAALAIWRDLDDRAGIAGAVGSLGLVHKARGDYDSATRYLDEALAHWRAGGHEARAAMVLNNLAAVASDRGDLARAEFFHEESLAIKRRTGDQPGIATSLHNLADIALHAGQYEQAVAQIEESLAISRALALTPHIAQSTHTAGVIACRLGDLPRAEALLRESLTLFRTLGVRWGTPLALEGLAEVAIARGEYSDAARLFGAAAAEREVVGTPLQPLDLPDHERLLAACRGALGEAGFTAAYTLGRTLPLERIVAGLLDPQRAPLVAEPGS